MMHVMMRPGLERHVLIGSGLWWLDVQYGKRAILDCSDLDLVDSAGLESLLWLTDELDKQGNKLRFASVSQTVTRAFELTRLERVFNVHDNVEAAARSFG